MGERSRWHPIFWMTRRLAANPVMHTIRYRGWGLTINAAYETVLTCSGDH